MQPGRVIWGTFGSAPFVEHLLRHSVESVQFFGRAFIDGQFQPVAIGVKKIDGIKNSMVDRSNYFEACLFETRLDRQ